MNEMNEQLEVHFIAHLSSVSHFKKRIHWLNLSCLCHKRVSIHLSTSYRTCDTVYSFRLMFFWKKKKSVLYGQSVHCNLQKCGTINSVLKNREACRCLVCVHTINCKILSYIPRWMLQTFSVDMKYINILTKEMTKANNNDHYLL